MAGAMDLTTLVGLLIAWGAVLCSILLEGGHLGAFWNLPAALIVIGGTIGVTAIGLPMRQAMGAAQVLMRAFLGRPVKSVEVIGLLSDLIRRARRDGVLGLELPVLEKQPGDPTANLAAGRYYCFVKGDWEMGIPMLALGSETALKELAE